LKTYQPGLAAVGSLVVSGFKDSARAGADRLLKPYLEPLASEVRSVREDVVSLVAEIRERLGTIEAHNRATIDEVRGVRGSSDLRLDHTNLRLHQILDEVGGVGDRMERLEQHFSTVEERFEQMSTGMRSHLDERFGQLEVRFDEHFGQLELLVRDLGGGFGELREHFGQLGVRVDEHFGQLEVRVDEHFGQLEVRVDEHFGQLEVLLRDLGGGLGQLRDSFGQLESRFARVEEHYVEVEHRIYERLDGNESTLVRYFEDQAKRQSELRSAMEDVVDASKKQLEKLELLMMAQLEGLFATVSNEAGAVRSDVEELTRMIRMQGDAADQVAEVVGRALTRLSSEVETLNMVVPALGGDVAATPA
jgi:chromosome segregation ATPase